MPTRRAPVFGATLASIVTAAALYGGCATTTAAPAPAAAPARSPRSAPPADGPPAPMRMPVDSLSARRAPVPLQSAQPPLYGDDVRSVRLARSLRVMAAPSRYAEPLGIVAAGTRVAWREYERNGECETPWLRIEPDGWLCARPGQLAPSTRAPTTTVQPHVRRGGIPGTYGKVAKESPVFASLEAAIARTPSRVAAGDIVRLSAVATAPEGAAFWKTQRGEYVDADRVRRLRGSRFRGVELGDADALALPLAFVARGRRRVPVLAEPTPRSRRVGWMDRGAWANAGPLSDDGEFVQLGDGRWAARTDVRLAHRATRPAQVGPDETWIDIDIAEQTAVAYVGDRPVLATLVSTGKRRDPTPIGSFRIYKKKARTTMASDRSLPQTYSVAVPWSMYFLDGYALHASYWHDGFGAPRSHGCINLAPADARRLYDLLEPRMPPGWLVAYSSTDRPGSLVRVRDSSSVRARRAPDDQRAALERIRDSARRAAATTRAYFLRFRGRGRS